MSLLEGVVKMEKLTEPELKKYEELEKKHLGDFDKKTGIYYDSGGGKMEYTPKQLLDEYGIAKLIESYVTNGEAMDVINKYIFTLINEVSELQKENKKLKEALEIVESEYWNR